MIRTLGCDFKVKKRILIKKFMNFFEKNGYFYEALLDLDLIIPYNLIYYADTNIFSVIPAY